MIRRMSALSAAEAAFEIRRAFAFVLTTRGNSVILRNLLCFVFFLGRFVVSERLSATSQTAPNMHCLVGIHGIEDVAQEGQVQFFHDSFRLLLVAPQTIELPEGDVQLGVHLVLELADLLRCVLALTMLLKRARGHSHCFHHFSFYYK